MKARSLLTRCMLQYATSRLVLSLATKLPVITCKPGFPTASRNQILTFTQNSPTSYEVLYLTNVWQLIYELTCQMTKTKYPFNFNSQKKQPRYKQDKFNSHKILSKNQQLNKILTKNRFSDRQQLCKLTKVFVSIRLKNNIIRWKAFELSFVQQVLQPLQEIRNFLHILQHGPWVCRLCVVNHSWANLWKLKASL